MRRHVVFELYGTDNHDEERWDEMKPTVPVSGSRRNQLIGRLRSAMGDFHNQLLSTRVRVKEKSPSQFGQFFNPSPFGREVEEDSVVRLLNSLTTVQRGEKAAPQIGHDTKFDIVLATPIDGPMGPKECATGRMICKELNEMQLRTELWRLAETFDLTGNIGPNYHFQIWTKGGLVGIVGKFEGRWRSQIRTSAITKYECWGYKRKHDAFMSVWSLLDSGRNIVRVKVYGPERGVFMDEYMDARKKDRGEAIWKSMKASAILKHFEAEYNIGPITFVEEFKTLDEVNGIWERLQERLEQWHSEEHQRWLNSEEGQRFHQHITS